MTRIYIYISYLNQNMRSSPVYSSLLSESQDIPMHHITINNPECWNQHRPSDNKVYNRRVRDDYNNANGDWWGAWLGIIICIILFIFLIFVLSYPTSYYYNDRNGNGIADNREWNYYHRHGFWP
jgi:hypothetical protein